MNFNIFAASLVLIALVSVSPAFSQAEIRWPGGRLALTNDGKCP